MPSPTDRNLTAPINPPRAHSMRTSQYVIVALALCITAACGDDNRGPTAPTAPTSTSFALSGRITNAETGSAIRYATVLILDGPHAGKTSTSAADGSYSITDVAGNMNVLVKAAGYLEAREGLAVLSATQRDFQLTPLTTVAPATGLVHVLYAAPTDREWCFRHQLLLPRPYLVLTKPLRLDIQCQRGASVKIGWEYLDD